MLKLILISLLAIVPIQGKDIILNSQNSLILEKAFDLASTSEVSQKISELASPDLTNILIPLSSSKIKDIYLVLVTPGGEVGAGLIMIDYINAILGVKVHTISLFAASMGFITAQGLNGRYITKSGTYMSHKIRGGFRGEFPGQLDSRYNYYLRRVKRLDENIAKRTNGKHTVKSYNMLMENEYWCEGQDCVDQGFADEVVNVSCDASLKGSEIKTITFSFLGMSATVKLSRSKCPTILGYKRLSATLKGKPYHFTNEVFNHYFDKKVNSFNNIGITFNSLNKVK